MPTHYQKQFKYWWSIAFISEDCIASHIVVKLEEDACSSLRSEMANAIRNPSMNNFVSNSKTKKGIQKRHQRNGMLKYRGSDFSGMLAPMAQTVKWWQVVAVAVVVTHSSLSSDRLLHYTHILLFF